MKYKIARNVCANARWIAAGKRRRSNTNKNDVNGCAGNGNDHEGCSSQPQYNRERKKPNVKRKIALEKESLKEEK